LEGTQRDMAFLDRAVTSTHFVVHYTLTNCGSSGNDCLNGNAEAHATIEILEQTYQLLVHDPGYVFPPPLGTGTVDSPQQLDVYILDLDGM